MASAAEARIRDKAERMLRDLFPDARIVHEFEVGGARLDLAAVTPDRLILVEIKSENDTLTRLEKQVEYSAHLGGLVLVCVAERWVGKMPPRSARAWRSLDLVEDGDGFTCFVGANYRYPMGAHHIDGSRDAYDSRALLDLLLKPELLGLARTFGGKSRHTVPDLAQLAHENMTGREIRRGVMAALRARRFGWTCDAPITVANDDTPAQPREAA